MIYVTTLIAVAVVAFLTGLSIQLIRMEKTLSETALFVEHKVSRIIRPTRKDS